MSTVTAQRNNVAPIARRKIVRRTKIRTQIFDALLRKNDVVVGDSATTRIARLIGPRVQAQSVTAALAAMEREGWVRRTFNTSGRICRVDLVHMPTEFEEPVLKLMASRERRPLASSIEDALVPPRLVPTPEMPVPPIEAAASASSEGVVLDLIDGIAAGEYDLYLEAILAAGHDRKRQLRGSWRPE